MNFKSFLKGLGLTTGLAGVVSFGLLMLPQIAPYRNVTIGSLVFFFLFTLLHYFVGVKTAAAPNKWLFIGVTQIITFAKLTLTLGFVVAYAKVVQPPNNWFILPFLLNYAIFTVFETVALMKVGQQKSIQ